MSTPHPGYFFNLTDEGREFAQGLIHYGFFEVNEDSLKTYFDPFKLYVTPKEDYANKEDVGRVSSTEVTGTEYWGRMVEARKDVMTSSNNFDLSTPREIVQKEDSKLLNRLRRRNIQGELDSMFEEQNSPFATKNTTKQKNSLKLFFFYRLLNLYGILMKLPGFNPTYPPPTHPPLFM